MLFAAICLLIGSGCSHLSQTDQGNVQTITRRPSADTLLSSDNCALAISKLVDSGSKDKTVNIYTEASADLVQKVISRPIVSISYPRLVSAIKSRDIEATRQIYMEKFWEMMQKNFQLVPNDKDHPFIALNRSISTIPVLQPAPGKYSEKTWKWDSQFGSMINLEMASHTSNPKHKEVLRTLGVGQYVASIQNQLGGGPNRGMIPHMNFPPYLKESEPANFELWGIDRHTIITQPEITSMALKMLDPSLQRRLFPSLRESVNWWLRERTDELGLIRIIHPWESGRDAALDNDPGLLKYIEKIEDPSPSSYNRLTRKQMSDARGKLVHLQREIATLPTTDQVTHLFDLKTPDMNSYVVIALEDAADIASNIFKDQALATIYRKEADKIRAAVNKYLWDENTNFYHSMGSKPDPADIERLGIDPRSVAVNDNNLIQAKIGSAFVTLAAGIPSKERALKLLKELQSPNFNTKWPIPTVAANNVIFEADQYWRGSTWININYLVIKGLIRYAKIFIKDQEYHHAAKFLIQAKKLAWQTEEMCIKGLYEYFVSTGVPTGSTLGKGPNDFTWSGLVINILEDLERINTLEKQIRH